MSGVCRGKNLTLEVWGNFFYPNQIRHTPSKVKWTAPYVSICSGEKAHMLFHDNNNLPEDQKLVAHSKR